CHRPADETLPPTPVDRDAAQPPQEPAEWPAEQLALAEPRRLHAEHVRDREHEREIPVRSVRCGDDDDAPVGRQRARHAPPEGAQVEPADQPRGARCRQCSAPCRAITPPSTGWTLLYGSSRRDTTLSRRKVRHPSRPGPPPAAAE